MEDLVFGIISLLIILPIIYFLPVGFTRKGKLLILLAAFIVFMIGIAARAILNVWQIGIVLILLALGFTYIIATRFGMQLFEHNEHNLSSEDKVIKFELEDGIEEEIRSKISQKEEVINLAPRQVNPTATEEKVEKANENPASLLEEIMVEDDMLSPNIQDEAVPEDPVENTPPLDKQLDEPLIKLENIIIDENNQNHEIVPDIVDEKENNFSSDYKLDDLLKELEQELENTNHESKDVDEVNDETIIEPQYSDELEEIKGPNRHEPKLVLDDIEIDSLQVNNEVQENETYDLTEDNQDILNVENEIQNEQSSEVELDEKESAEDDSSIINLELEDEEHDSQENELQTEEIKIDELNFYDTETEHKPSNESSYEIDSITSVGDDEPESDVHNTNDEMKQLLFHTMVSQIKLSRNQLTSTEYEKLIIDHLHPTLSDHDYYTFVSLLIDHYLDTKNYEELSKLISKNMHRFEKYPVILQEINFLLKEYCRI